MVSAFLRFGCIAGYIADILMIDTFGRKTSSGSFIHLISSKCATSCKSHSVEPKDHNHHKY